MMSEYQPMLSLKEVHYNSQSLVAKYVSSESVMTMNVFSHVYIPTVFVCTYMECSAFWIRDDDT